MFGGGSSAGDVGDMGRGFPSLLQPQHALHRAALFNWNAWLAFQSRLPQSQASLFRPPFPPPQPPLAPFPQLSAALQHQPAILGPNPTQPRSSRSSKASSSRSSFSVNSLLQSRPAPPVALRLLLDGAPVLCRLQPMAKDDYVLSDAALSTVQDNNGAMSKGRIADPSDAAESNEDLPSGAVMSLEATCGETELGGTFARTALLGAGHSLRLPPGRKLRLAQAHQEWNIRMVEDGGGWELRRSVAAGEELVALATPPRKESSVDTASETISPNSSKDEAKEEGKEEGEEEKSFPPIEEYEGEQPAEGGQGFGCERCGKVFSYRYYRDKHLKYTRCVDLGDRKFPCELCPRSFEKRDRLRIHVLHVHEKHRPHSCGVCGKRFSQSSSLNKHLRVHSGERPYKCLHCPKSFTASSILRTHVRQHSGEKPFQCRHCGKAFASHAAHDSHVRRTHLAAGSPDAAHACALCRKTFSHAAHLHFHLQSAHAQAQAEAAVEGL